MARAIGRRARLFALISLVGLALVYPTPPDLRGAAWFVVALAGFWAVMLAVEDLTVPVYPDATKRRPPVDNPFARPPPPRSRHSD